jgi:hypothetical protein
MTTNAPNTIKISSVATHYPLLAGVIAKTTSNILELGVGHYSTPMLSFISKATRRTVVSVDTDQDWIDFFEKSYNSLDHHFICTDGNNISNAFLKHHAWENALWDVAFIDCAPADDRVNCIEILRERSKYIIVHDAEPEAVVYKWGDVFKSFPNRYCFDAYGTSAMCLSMKENCEWLF